MSAGRAKSITPTWKRAQGQAQRQAHAPRARAERALPVPTGLSLLPPGVQAGKMMGICRNILRHNQHGHWMVSPEMINFFQAPHFLIVGVDTDIQSPAHRIQRWFRARRLYHSLVGNNMTLVSQAGVVIACSPAEALLRAKVALALRARTLWIQPHASTKEVLSWVNTLSSDARSRVICQADLLVRGHAALVLGQQWFTTHDRDPSERKLLPMN